MNQKWDVLQRHGLDMKNSSSLFPVWYKPRLFDRPETDVKVYNQFRNAIIKDVLDNSDKYFESRSSGVAGEPEIQPLNTPHHHNLIFLEVGVLAGLDKIVETIFVYLPTAEQGRELWILVEKFKINRLLPFCRGRTSNGQCLFRYETIDIALDTNINETCNSSVERKRKEKDLKVVSYNLDLRKPIRATSFWSEGKVEELWSIRWNTPSNCLKRPVYRWWPFRNEKKEAGIPLEIMLEMTSVCICGPE